MAFLTIKFANERNITSLENNPFTGLLDSKDLIQVFFNQKIF